VSIQAEVAAARADYERRSGQARLLITQYRDAVQQAEDLTERVDDLEQIASLLNLYADERQAEVQGKIEAIVSKGLQTIFGEDLYLRLETKLVGKRSEIDFVLVSKNGAETLETSIMDARGGGVAAVAGFLIQAVLVLLTPGLRPVLFLDESFSQVSLDYQPGLSAFIKELVDRSDLQVVLVSHSEVFGEDADQVYRFTQTDGVTTVQEVS